jgi:putative flippase GtrA
MAVGFASTVVHYAIMAVLARLCGVPALWASQIGFVASGFLSYLLNRSFTFRVPSAHIIALPRYVVACAIGLSVNGAALVALQALLHHLWLAQLGASGVVAVTSFLLQRHVVFNERKYVLF